MERIDAKNVEWLGPTRRDVQEFPDEVRNGLGYALFLVQIGERPAICKTYQGAIQELREQDDQSRAYRLVYIAKFDEAIYVLHAFVKKSNEGIATRQHDRDLIEQRY